jgi:hypothetical protein
MTVSLDDDIYLSLVNCAANDARTGMSRLSLSRTLQKIMLEELNKLHYYPPKSPNEKAGSLVRERMKMLRPPHQVGSTNANDSSPLLSTTMTLGNLGTDHREKPFSF